MIIECQACRARFKLDESRIKGKGARIRCRKCGEAIIVMKSDIAPPGMSPPPGKEMFDLRTVLHEPEQRTPVSPREGAGTRFEHPIASEQERKPSPPPGSQEPAQPVEEKREVLPTEVAGPATEPPPLLRSEVDASFDSLRFREEKDEEPFLPPRAEEPAQPEEEKREVLPTEVAEPATEPTLLRSEFDASFDSLRFREDKKEEPFLPPRAEEPAQSEEEERESFPPEVAEPGTEPTLLRNEGEASFEIPLFREEEEPFPPPAAEEPAHPVEEERIVFPEEVAEPAAEEASPPRVEIADGFATLFQHGREHVTIAEEPMPPAEGTDAAFPAVGEEKAELDVFREPREDLTLDLDLPGFLRKEQPTGQPAGAFDISERLRDVPFEVPEAKTATGPETTGLLLPPGESPLSRADTIQDELADLAGRGTVEESPGEAHPPPDLPPPRPSEMGRIEVPRSRRSVPSGRPSVVLLVLLFLTLAGGGAYLAFTETGQETLRAIVPGMESLWLGGKGSVNPYHVGNLIGYYETGDNAGKMFVIKGLATNQGRTKKSGIRIRAELLDGNNQRIAEKTVYAGNVVTGLRTATREKIEAAMENRFGERLSNVDVAPGKAVPFMVTFFDPPDGIEEYRLEALDGD